jgi:uncharacterized protein (DUF433 family)
MQVSWKDYIVSTPGVLRGKPRLKGTRIPVGLMLGYLASGKKTAAIKKEFPGISETQIAACLDYARELADYEVITA